MANLAVLEQWIATQPRRLSFFERFLGPLRGTGHVSCEVGGVAGVESISALQARSHYAADRDREPTFTSVSIVFTAPPADVIACVEARLGPGRRARDPRSELEWLVYREGFMVATDVAIVRWEQLRPDWAHPAVPITTRQDFLLTLVDRLVCESEAAPILSALEPFAATNGIRFSRAARSSRELDQPSHEGFSVHFEPAIDSALVVAAFRWTEPVAMRQLMGGTLMLGPRASLPRAYLGTWEIDATLREVPRDARYAIALPNVGTDASPLYDVTAGPTTTWMITVLPADA